MRFSIVVPKHQAADRYRAADQLVPGRQISENTNMQQPYLVVQIGNFISAVEK